MHFYLQLMFLRPLIFFSYYPLFFHLHALVSSHTPTHPPTHLPTSTPLHPIHTRTHLTFPPHNPLYTFSPTPTPTTHCTHTLHSIRNIYPNITLTSLCYTHSTSLHPPPPHPPTTILTHSLQYATSTLTSTPLHYTHSTSPHPSHPPPHTHCAHLPAARWMDLHAWVVNKLQVHRKYISAESIRLASQPMFCFALKLLPALKPSDSM